MRFDATSYDNHSTPISGLTFLWHLNSSGIGMLDRLNGSTVNFTALYAGITEIYAVNGSISSNKTYTVWLTVNTTPGTGIVVDGAGNVTAGNSTAIVNLDNTSVVGTINIVAIDDPLNCTDVSGNITGLGTDVELIKGVNITVDESIAEAMATDANGSSYVHVRIGYNESELGDIDESTLHIYKFESGTGWLRMNETENPDYCNRNGRNTTANYVWANVTSCSVFGLGGGSSATSDSTPAIQSWWNNRTGNDSLNLSINMAEPVEFGAVFNQTGNITWNATGHTNVTNTSVNSGNQTFSWDASGSNYLNVSIMNDNGTSEILRWNITVTALPEPPSIISHWNNRTGNDSLNLSINTTEPVEFSVVFNQTGNITWNATDHLSRSNETVCSGNQTFSWDASGSKYLNVSIMNDNGTSETLRWNIVVTTPPVGQAPSQAIYVNETGWWQEGSTFNQNETPIHAAVDNATNGSHIFVYNGSYTENVVIDKSITLEGEGMDVVGVSAESFGNVFKIETSWVNISGFTLKDSYSSGVYLYEADHCNISNNNASNNGDGICLYSSSNNTLQNNIASDNNNGIRLHSSSNNTLSGNTMSENRRNFKIYGDGISHYTQSIDASNTVDGRPIYYWIDQVNDQIPDDAGFVGVVNSTNITVKDLRLTNNHQGVLFAYSKNSRIVNVTTLNNDYGIYLLSSINNTLQKNNVSNSIDGGIYLLSSINNTLQNNIVSDNWYYGIYIHKSNYNNISNNIVKDNYRNWGYDGRAIYINDYSEHNTITDNTIEHNTYGIFIDSGSGNNTVHTNVVKDNRDGVYVTSGYNLIYNNYILSNKNYDAKDTTGDNRWNITKTSGINILGGSYLGGNYYSEYTGSDEDGDGLGDTPFIIADKDTKDHHPLVSTILVSERWNSKTGDNLTLTVNISENVDFYIKYSQIGNISWEVWRYGEVGKNVIENRENTSCSEANQTFLWDDTGTMFVDVWLTNDNGTSNKTEWIVTVNTNVEGTVMDDSGDLTSNITYYDANGVTVLHNIVSHKFNFTGVPLYGYLEIDAFSTKNTSVRFCISGKSTNAVITINETKENPATSFEPPEIPIKYIKAQSNNNLKYNDIILKISYSDDELNGVSEGALAIYRMEGNSWNRLTTQRDTANNILTAPPPSLGWFAVACPTGVGVCTQLKISTDKATYLLDPYYWVYEAPSDLWPPDGYDRTVNFTVLLMDHRGYRVNKSNVNYTVSNGTTVITSGTAHDRGDGLYTASFEITDADSGGINFDGSDPEYFTIRVEASTSDGIIDGSKTFRVGRWGCDRCHIEQSLAESVYPWCEPCGNRHHTWNGVLGESDDPFDLSYLTNSELTHTPREYLDNYPWWHERTNRKHPDGHSSGRHNCSPCHQGSGVVREDDSAVVECTFCHGIDGGYNADWAESAGYAYGEHTKVDPPHDSGPADQSCSNASCHGHISDTGAGEIDNAYPACADCHPISFGSEVPQWLDTSTGEPRDVGGHPSGDSPVVNCSFCHNAFHATADENDILTCDDCHPQSENYPIHPYEGYQGENTATCANCHCGGVDNMNIHNISAPRCSDCHDSVYDDISEGYDNYAMNDDQGNLAPIGSNMTHKRDTRVSTFGHDPPGLSWDGSGGSFYSRHAYPDSSGGWPGTTKYPRNGDQICINCHSEIVRETGAWHDGNWKRDSYYSCKPCHNLWYDDATCGSPNVHYLSVPHCTDCHAATLPDPWHGVWDPATPPKNYMRTPVIGLMLEQSIHKRLILNTTTDKPSNYLGCLICHTNASFSIDYGDFEITITDYDGVHRWNSLPSCTKCHSLSDDVSRPGPPAYAHDLLDGIEWGNNTQCLECHNIYDQTAGRCHGHDASTESCTGCHYNYTAMDDYGTPEVYVNETMYQASVHGTDPGDDCAKCHTDYHPPPEYKWKWCDCCHVVQSDPVNDVDRHDVTGSPTTLDVTDCTECHNETSYDNSVARYGGASAEYNCRWCHTYPDQEYE